MYSKAGQSSSSALTQAKVLFLGRGHEARFIGLNESGVLQGVRSVVPSLCSAQLLVMVVTMKMGTSQTNSSSPS